MSRLKIKLKLFLRSMRKSETTDFRETNNTHCNKEEKRRLKTRNFLSRHIGSVFSQKIKKSQEMLSDAKEGNHDAKIDRAKKELLDEQGKRMVGRQLIAPEDQEKLVRREKVYSGERSLRHSVHAGKQERSKKLARIPSRRSCSRKKGRHAKFMLNKVIQQGEQSENEEEEEEEESRGIELCKKKILMGEKCRPLNKSGILQYDENGFLLLEEP